MSSNTLTDEQMRSTLQIEPPAETVADDPASVSDASDTSTEPAAEAKTTETAPPKTDKKRARYEELDRERHDLRRENERLRADREREVGSLREEFQREMAELRRMAQPKPQEQVKPQAAQPDAGTDPEPDPGNNEKYPDGQFDRKYLKDQARWEARQEFQSIQQQQRERYETAQRERQQFERQQAEVTRIKTLETRMKQAFTSDPSLESRLSNVSMTRPMWDVAMESEKPHQILAYMAEHPEEAERIASLPPLHAFRALSRIEYELDAAANLTGSASGEKPKTSAHPPVSPVSGSHAVPRSGEPGPDASYDEHKAYWNKVEAESRGRR